MSKKEVQKQKTLEDFTILELKGIMYDLQVQIQHVNEMINRKVKEEQDDIQQG